MCISVSLRLKNWASYLTGDVKLAIKDSVLAPPLSWLIMLKSINLLQHACCIKDTTMRTKQQPDFSFIIFQLFAYCSLISVPFEKLNWMSVLNVTSYLLNDGLKETSERKKVIIKGALQFYIKTKVFQESLEHLSSLNLGITIKLTLPFPLSSALHHHKLKRYVLVLRLLREWPYYEWTFCKYF